MEKTFKTWDYGIVQLKQMPRDYWFVYDFDEKDNIKSVCVYARKWVRNTINWNRYADNDKTSTFLHLCKMWRWLQGVCEMSEQELEFALNVELDGTINEPYENFVEKLTNNLQ